MSDHAFDRLRTSAAALCVRVWRDEHGDVYIQQPGEEPRPVRPTTLSAAGWVRCRLYPAPCRIDAQHRPLGQRVACSCGQVSLRLPPVILARFAANKKPAGEAG